MSHYKPYPAYKISGVECLGMVPEHWQQLPLKRLVRSIEQGWSPECESWPATGEEWGVLKVGCVNGGSFRPEENKALPVTLEPRPELAVCKGDVLVSRANTRELVGSCVAVPQDYPSLLLCDKIYRIRVGERVTPEFLAALITVHGRRAVEIEATGASSSMLNISQSVILDLPVALPESAEQDQIMAAATRETARIDALVAKKTRFIELLREKRQALITHAVTKGLDPNVKMKDSGVEWLGEVPEHWEIRQLRSIAIESLDGFVDGDWIESPFITDEGIRLIQTGNVGVGEYREQGFRYISEETFKELRCTEFHPGDILICRLGDPVGRACFAPDLGCRMITSVDNVILKPKPQYARSYFLHLFCSAGYLAFFEAECRGATRDRVSRSMLGSMLIPIPEGSEQRAIAAHLDRETTRIDALKEKTERSIDLLKERRSALITAAVTGQIDLREAV